ncbi:MAG: hypothetical protein K6E29_01540 [Cyanobacteria bacterium RUI128]|nr:hypothetical protein [Cyanobacteria bacterium RUI128]
MISSINNSDIQRARAEAFVNKDDKSVAKIAGRINSIKHHKDHKRASDIAGFATKSIPFIAAASTLAMGKGVKSAAKQGAIWGALIGVPALVVKANQKIKAGSATPENKNGKGMSFGGELVATLAGFWGATAAINKLAANKKVNSIADTVIKKSKEAYTEIASKVKIPEGLAKTAGELSEKAKRIIPENVKTFVGDTAAKVQKSQAFKTAAEKGAKFGKNALKYAPEIALGSVVLGTLAYGVKEGLQVSKTKNQLKEDQLKTAKVLISSYKEENEALKSQLAEKAEEV